MKRQHWTVTRRHVGHRAAQRRWDQAFQLLLATPAMVPDVAVTVPPGGGLKESRHARSRLRSGIDHVPGPGANH
jgi:hypothetical protein